MRGKKKTGSADRQEKEHSRQIKGTAHPNVTRYVNQTSIASIRNYRRGERSRWGTLLCVCGL